MSIPSTKRKVYNLLVVAPIIWVGLIALPYSIFSLVMATANQAATTSDAPYFSLFLFFHFIFTILTFYLMGWLIHKIYTITFLTNSRKAFLVIMILCFNAISIPIIYYRHIKNLI